MHHPDLPVEVASRVGGFGHCLNFRGPPLTPAELIYQRMLAGDPVEAAEQARMCRRVMLARGGPFREVTQ
jgi:hypothetical protein